MIKIPKGNFLPDVELAAFIHKGCIGMFCFGEETFLEIEDEEEKGGSGGRLEGRMFT